MNAPKHMANITRMKVERNESGEFTVTPLPLKKPGMMVACMMSNAQRISPLGEGHIPKGTLIEVELLRGTEYIQDA